jgi:hypothetical protein
VSEGAARPTIIDEEHLKLLSLGYMISAAIGALFSLFGLFYVFMGLMMGSLFSHVSATAANPDNAPPAFIGWILAGFGAAFIVVLGTLALLKFKTASCIKQRRSRIFCMVIAGISCLEFPYGTALGVATFIVLGRDSVIRLFDSVAAPPPVA